MKSLRGNHMNKSKFFGLSPMDCVKKFGIAIKQFYFWIAVPKLGIRMSWIRFKIFRSFV